MKRLLRIVLLALLIAIPFAGFSPFATAQTDYAKIGRETVSAIAQEQWPDVEARFDPRMKTALPQEKLATTWTQITTQAGPFKHIAGIQLSQQDGYHIALVACIFAQANLDAKVVIDTQGRIAGLFFVPSASEPSSSSPDAAAIGSTTVDALAHGKFGSVESRFDERMKAALPEEKLSATWAQITSQAGPFEHIMGIQLTQQDGYHIALVTCAFAQSNLDAKVVLDASGHIAGLFFLPSSTKPAPAANM